MNAAKEEKSTLSAGRLFYTLMTGTAKYEDLTGTAKYEDLTLLRIYRK